ncbi:uncharacterized protein TrAtP1_011356 [Trichoderma atroviride]|uniref:uncharacterized protein n=1 Tax=Hypocrea atroviridis TaxID=63577 RepID=UPI003324AF05|nr:hypothetical protein TrAtP1_011356 [Trichoderma atroviride]
MLGASRIRTRGSDVLAEIPDKNVLEGQKCVRGKGETGRQETENLAVPARELATGADWS